MMSSASYDWLEGLYEDAAEWTHGRLLGDLAQPDGAVHTQLVAAACDSHIDSFIEADAAVLIVFQVVIKTPDRDSPLAVNPASRICAFQAL